MGLESEVRDRKLNMKSQKSKTHEKRKNAENHTPPQKIQENSSGMKLSENMYKFKKGCKFEKTGKCENNGK